jgi:hypothetical protein
VFEYKDDEEDCDGDDEEESQFVETRTLAFCVRLHVTTNTCSRFFVAYLTL